MSFDKNEKLNFSYYRAIFIDFDGVLTDNSVMVSEDGKEYVKCSRSDGLAFNYLNEIGFPAYIISSEANKVVQERAKKLNIECRSNLKSKVNEIKKIIKQKTCNPKKIILVGNDINDLGAMNFCGLTFCPSDSHPIIKKNANVVLNSVGGHGVIREILENWFNLDLAKKYFREFSHEY